MTNFIEINDHGLRQRMARFPHELAQAEMRTMEASLLIVHENIPPYPNVPRPVRTGMLGRSLGSSMQGGAAGKPSIYEIKRLGEGLEGHFGTNLEYAEYVIGEKQAWFHYRWWLLKNVAKQAEKRIVEKWKTMAEKLAQFLDGKGL